MLGEAVELDINVPLADHGIGAHLIDLLLGHLDLPRDSGGIASQYPRHTGDKSLIFFHS